MKHLLARAMIVLAASVVASAALAATATAPNYVVLYKGSSVGSDAATAVQKAGGTFVYAYPQIGVVIAKSDSASFRANMMKDNRVDGVTGTGGYATQINDGSIDSSDGSGGGGSPGDLPNLPSA